VKKNKALFVSHEDDNSGAPRVLYNLLKFIVKNYELDVDIFVTLPKYLGIFEKLKNETYLDKTPEIFYHKESSKSRIIRKITTFIDRKIFAKR